MSIAAASSTSVDRRHDVDWLRTYALGLLIIYHCAISFQPWGILIGFIQNKQSLQWLWPIMSLVNVWRIPILFLVSGMGVRFAMERRDWKALLKDRSIRILIPFVFGYFAICPIFILFTIKHYGGKPIYAPNPGHLWFLGNIFVYVLLLLPLLVYLRKRPENGLHRGLQTVFSWPAGLLLISIPLIAEAVFVNPPTFQTYAMTPHGFWYGMVCFLLGFVLVSVGNPFWKAAEKTRFIALAVAIALYLGRWLAYEFIAAPSAMIAFESTCWMLAILGFGSRHLNKPSANLAFYSRAVFPVYILHMPVQFGLSYFLIPLSIPALLKFLMLVNGTLAISFLIYAFVIRRVNWLKPLFGMPTTRKPQRAMPVPVSSDSADCTQKVDHD